MTEQSTTEQHMSRRGALTAMASAGVAAVEVDPAAVGATRDTDLTLVNGRITTLDPRTHSATGLAVRDGAQ